jgi:predicted nucleic acid-binding protein
MSRTLVDTNVFLDLVTADLRWLSWSSGELAVAGMSSRLVVIDVIYAELSIRFEDRARVDELLADFKVGLESLHRDALFLAGRAYREYRASGGTRTGVLPDFFIGAHAAVEGLSLLTRDPRRYRSYFPNVQLIAP